MIKISDFQSKDVINLTDGKRLGRISDLELDLNQGRVRALVIPGTGRFFGLFAPGGSSSDIIIPWSNIVKIGTDVILVRLEGRYAADDYESSQGEIYRPQLGSGKNKN